MHDDDAMDRLLTEALAAKPPQLSPDFDARVLRRARPRRLTPLGRGVLAAYTVAAAAAALWTLRDLPAPWILAAVAISAAVAAGARAYARRLAFQH